MSNTQSIKEVLADIFKFGTPEDPADIHWQNETMRQIIADALPELTNTQER